MGEGTSKSVPGNTAIKEEAQVLDQSEMQDFKHEVAKQPYHDLTVDAQPDNDRDTGLDYDKLQAITAPKPKELETATWEDLRSLGAPPPRDAFSGNGTVFVNVKHPNTVVMDGGRVVARFRNGYLATDDPKIIRLLTRPKNRYVKQVTLSQA